MFFYCCGKSTNQAVGYSFASLWAPRYNIFIDEGSPTSPHPPPQPTPTATHPANILENPLPNWEVSLDGGGCFSGGGVCDLICVCVFM